MSDDIKPAYSLQAIIDKSVVDPGDTVKIEYYIYGGGDISNPRFQFHIPDELVDGRAHITTFAFGHFPDGRIAGPMCPPETHDLKSHVLIKLVPGYFKQSNNTDIKTLFSEQFIVCEGVEYAPVSVTFKVSRDVHPGEQIIPSTFIYETRNEVGVSSAIATLRVRSFGERNQVALVTILTILLFITPLVFNKLPEQYRVWWIATVAALVTILLLLIWK
jgi:hypothetical protein